MKKSMLSCLAALALLSAATPLAARAGGRQNATAAAETVARLQKARAENRRVVIRFKNGASVTGRVGEVRDRGFTLEPDSADDALVLKGENAVAAVLYEDVAAVQYPSKMRKFFKGVRFGFMAAAALVIVPPIYGVEALLGRLPEC